MTTQEILREIDESRKYIATLEDELEMAEDSWETDSIMDAIGCQQHFIITMNKKLGHII